MFTSQTKIKLDPSLYDRLKELARRAGYSSTEELITHVLEREVAKLEQATTDDDVKKRLRGLGYIE